MESLNPLTAHKRSLVREHERSGKRHLEIKLTNLTKVAERRKNVTVNRAESLNSLREFKQESTREQKG